MLFLVPSYDPYFTSVLGAPMREPKPKGKWLVSTPGKGLSQLLPTWEAREPQSNDIGLGHQVHLGNVLICSPGVTSPGFPGKETSRMFSLFPS